jgi:hypothetical protein
MLEHCLSVLKLESAYFQCLQTGNQPSGHVIMNQPTHTAAGMPWCLHSISSLPSPPCLTFGSSPGCPWAGTCRCAGPVPRGGQRIQGLAHTTGARPHHACTHVHHPFINQCCQVHFTMPGMSTLPPTARPQLQLLPPLLHPPVISEEVHTPHPPTPARTCGHC